MIRRSVLLSSCVLALSLLLSAHARAFDGDRKGFVFGFGAGPGYLDFGQDRDHTTGVQTDLVLGSGLNEQTIIHYTGKQIWHSKNDIFYTEAMPMLGVTRYFNAAAPSPFVSGGGGLGILAATYGSEVGAAIGPAVFVAGGFEFARHFNVEAGVAATWADHETLYNASMTIHWLGY